MTYTERFGLGGAYITKATVQLMRDFGATPAPMNAYLLNVGLETLHLRMPQHCANALAVAKFVQKHPKIAWVNYPGLEGDKYHDLAQKYMPKGTCGVVTFGVKGGRKAAETFMAGLKLASIATHVADAKTCVLHPASSTHRQLSEAELAAAGVSADLIRLSVGIGGLCVKMIPWQPLSINSFRSFISVGILLVFARLTRRRLRLTGGVVLGGLAVCGATALYTVATKLTTAGNAVLLQFTAPIFVILCSWAVFRERPKRLDLAACVCVFGGVFCFFLDSLGSGRFLGDVIAVLAGICYAWVFLLNKIPGGDPLWSTILGQSMGAVIGLPWLVRETQFDGTTLCFGILLGVFQLGLAYALLTTGIRYIPPVTASLITGIEPVLNPILVALVLGETLTRLSLLGGGIVFVSVMLYNVLSVRGAPQSPQNAGQTLPQKEEK